ncbi:GNAT family N-acetyltransferase [Hoeflea sp. YIM 152468]|uniref:GNAT family N-acetyltransferase n=1 Tax=Hoeflea sp. YIM 152468 TaxID=3031759 RepID=UPI0023DCD6B8|nr:GNAT family N-acetyltransferase [Hoeflea sp. YIM 152468]MDF1607321.1 GNAT family N-acetyltransferase [Hoeflea sp. YIM 152468]
MTFETTDHTLSTIDGLSAVTEREWGGLGGASRACQAESRGSEAESAPVYNPFVSHAFLSSLEESGSVSAQTGWLPRHIVLRAPDGALEGAMPAYIKSHSMGEYVFDHAWADAYERAGGRYYPKLQCAAPFTPATGPRLMVRPGAGAASRQRALAAGGRALCTQLGLSSVHATFVPEAEIPAFEAEGYLHRTDQQFHFRNENYRSYEDFLVTLASRKRKQLKKERRTALENGIEIVWLTGSELTESVWDIFYQFYIDTGGRKWGRPYLTRAFFSLIGERMADDVLLVMAERDGRFIAGAINFIGGDCLYGRHWGCIEDHPFLHFEVCYHQAIDFAIARGLARVEAGAQGEHKLARGYLPATTHSAHYIEHPGLRRAVADYLDRERRDVAHIGQVLSEHGPFRKGD